MRLLVTVFLGAFLFGCKELGEVDVVGSASSPVFPIPGVGVNINSLEVLRYCLRDERITFEQKWLISRQESRVEVSKVKYGEVPSGFMENSAHWPLQEREIYSVEVAGLKADYSGFFVIEEGKIKVLGNIKNLEGWIQDNRNRLKVDCE
jgi:hypothetical protein